MSKASRIPDQWPRAMRDDVAAAYVGLSTSLFRSKVKTRDAPAPIRIGTSRIVWLKEDLDQWLDELAGKTPNLDDGSGWINALAHEN